MSWHLYRNGSLIERGGDTARTVTDYTTTPPTVRPYTHEENAAADQHAAQQARLDDHEARIHRIEATLWPAPTQPADPADPSVPDWAGLGGIWPDGGLLRDGGALWRNVAGVPLTNPPSGFPGQPDQWTHLFVRLATIPDPVTPAPDRPASYIGPWDAATSYAVGDVCDRAGRYYRAKIAHGAEYGGTWGPPLASVWDDIGPAT